MSDDNILKEITSLLKVLKDDWQDTHAIAQRVSSRMPLSSLLLCAESLGFIVRQIKNETSPVSEAQWRITSTGKRFIKFAEANAETEIAAEDTPSSLQVVVTVPKAVREAFQLRNVGTLRTQDAFYDLLRDAREEVLIFSPYIDASFAQLADAINKEVRVRLVTTINNQAGVKPPASLARAAASHPNFELRYLYKQNEFGGQQTQIHGKLIISDREKGYVGSANLTETSILHNLELGVLISDQYTIQRLRNIFFDVFENFARAFS